MTEGRGKREERGEREMIQGRERREKEKIEGRERRGRERKETCERLGRDVGRRAEAEEPGAWMMKTVVCV